MRTRLVPTTPRRASRIPRRRFFSLSAGTVFALGLGVAGLTADATASELRVRIGSDIGTLGSGAHLRHRESVRRGAYLQRIGEV